MKGVVGVDYQRTAASLSGRNLIEMKQQSGRSGQRAAATTVETAGHPGAAENCGAEWAPLKLAANDEFSGVRTISASSISIVFFDSRVAHPFASRNSS
jgi:hypothetical protein